MRGLLSLIVLGFSLSAQSALVENVAARNDPAQTYTLYLPSSYDGAKKHPLLLILDPRGRGSVAAEIFREAAEEQGWILISANGTRSDEDDTANENALRALWPEIGRYAADPRRVYAAGFSGTAMVAWSAGINTGALAGVIGVGGRLVDAVPPEKFSFAHFGFAGTRDFNHREMRVVDERLEREGKTHRFEPFDGEHQWITPALAREALAWMEIVAMREERRPRDAALIAKTYASEIAAASALEQSARKLDALRRYRAAVRTFDTLHPTGDARAAIARLERDAEVSRTLAEEAKWDAFEATYVKETFGRMARLLSDDPARMLRNFRVAELQTRATRPGAEGAAARRLLAALHAQMSCYVPRALEARGDRARAKAARAVAEAISRAQ